MTEVNDKLLFNALLNAGYTEDQAQYFALILSHTNKDEVHTALTRIASDESMIEFAGCIFERTLVIRKSLQDLAFTIYSRYGNDDTFDSEAVLDTLMAWLTDEQLLELKRYLLSFSPPEAIGLVNEFVSMLNKRIEEKRNATQQREE